MTSRATRSPLLRWALFSTFLIGVGLLSLADRAPGRVVDELRRVRAVGQRVEYRLGIDWVDRGDIPLAWDTAGHIVLWSVAAMLGFLALHGRVGVVVLALALLTLSAAVEVGQAFLSSSRSPELTDLMANGAGIALGIVMASIVERTAHHIGSRRLA